MAVSIKTPGTARKAAIEGTNLYVADDDAGVLVFDISDLTAPRFIANNDTKRQCYSVASYNGCIYLADLYRLLVLKLADKR